MFTKTDSKRSSIKQVLININWKCSKQILTKFTNINKLQYLYPYKKEKQITINCSKNTKNVIKIVPLLKSANINILVKLQMFMIVFNWITTNLKITTEMVIA